MGFPEKLIPGSVQGWSNLGFWKVGSGSGWGSFKPPSNPNHPTIPRFRLLSSKFSPPEASPSPGGRKSQIHPKKTTTNCAKPAPSFSQCPPPSTERSHPSFICHLPPSSLRGLLRTLRGHLLPLPEGSDLGRGGDAQIPERVSARLSLPGRRNLQRALAESPPLQSRALPRDFATERNHRGVLLQLFHKSLIPWETRNKGSLLFLAVLFGFFLFLFPPFYFFPSSKESF